MYLYLKGDVNLIHNLIELIALETLVGNAESRAVSDS